MAERITFQDGDYSIAFAVSLPVFSSLLPNSAARQVLTDEWVQELADFVPLAFGTAHPDYPTYKLVEEGPHRDLQGGKVQWTRTWMLKPTDYEEFGGTHAFTFPGFSGVLGTAGGGTVGYGGSGEGRNPLNLTVERKVARAYFETTNPAADIPILPQFEVYFGSPSTKTDYVHDTSAAYAGTTPNRTAYNALVTAGTYIVAQRSTVQRLRGNIYVRETVYVKAQ